MGHFTITLPNNQQGDVRQGTVRKKSTLLNFLKGNKSDNEIKKGYIVKIEPNSTEQKEYRLLKSKEGNWISEDDGGFQVTPDDEISLSIKKAIDNYESQH
jgi:hypothetical protein